MKRLLWIVPKWPLPADDGARQATTQLIKNLAAKQTSIHLCPIVDGNHNIDDAFNELGVDKVTLISKKPTTFLRRLRALICHPLWPLTLAPYATKDVSRQIEQILSTYPEDIDVVFDGLHAGAWLLSSSRKRLNIIYRAHNAESQLWKRSAKETRNLIFKFFLKYQAQLVTEVEKLVIARSHFVFPVSQQDEKLLSNFDSDARFLTLPIGMSISEADSITSICRNRQLLFVGRLDWPPNRDGLKWFLKEVWPVASKNNIDLQLTIIGSGEHSWLKPYLHLPRIEFLGRVPDTAPHYHRSMASIVPVFYGSGTRVKAIESSLRAKPCISTALGVEGLDLVANEHFFQAETKQQWIEVLEHLTTKQCLATGRAARGFLSQRFDAKTIAQQFIETMAWPRQ